MSPYSQQNGRRRGNGSTKKGLKRTSRISGVIPTTMAGDDELEQGPWTLRSLIGLLQIFVLRWQSDWKKMKNPIKESILELEQRGYIVIKKLIKKMSI